MHSERLADALGLAELPDSTAAVERTVLAARELAERTGRPELPERRSRGRRAIAFAVVALIVAGFIALTPSGRATAEWIEKLFTFGGVANQEPIGFGTSPSGSDYEVRIQNTENGGGKEACLQFAWEPAPKGTTGGFGLCGSALDPRDGLEVPSISVAPGGELLVGGVSNRDVSAAQLEYRLAPGTPPVEVPAGTFPLDADSLEEVGGDVQTSSATLIVGFLPKDIGQVTGSTSAELVVVDGDGERLTEQIAWIEGPVEGTLTSCAMRRGPFLDECRSAVDPEFRHRELLRSLAAPQPPPRFLARAEAAGLPIEPLSDSELEALPETLGTPIELMDAIGAARGTLNETLRSKAGSYTGFLVRDAGGSVVFAIRFRQGVGIDGPNKGEALALIDAVSGEVRAAARLPR